ncbi:MAG: ParB-like nuclease domain-containing protein [Candidatus Aenigmatarchaeota archaeon]|nr:MAG: ParB-like nuclease domain-containing protein [Candidatus Aenigmarchaeota archaeon]
MKEIIEIEVDKLVAGDNPREKIFEDSDERDRFVQTVESVGYEGLDPIIIYPTQHEGKYEIDDGHRRLDAASILEWKKLRCIVAPCPRTEAQKFFKRVRRNVNQKKLSGWEKYKVVIKGVREFKYSQEKVAIDSGIDKSEVSRIVAISTFYDLVNFLENGGHLNKAYQLSRIKDEKLRKEILDQLKQDSDSYSVAQLRIIVKDGITFDEPKPPIETPRIGSEDETDGQGSEDLSDSHPDDFEEPDDGEDVSEQTAQIPQDGEGESDSAGVENQKESELDVAKTQPDAESTPDSPSKTKDKPDQYDHVWRCTICGHYEPSKKEAKAHECPEYLKGVQRFLKNLDYETGRFLKQNNDNKPVINPALKPYNLSKESIPHIDDLFDRIKGRLEQDCTAWEDYKKILRET